MSFTSVLVANRGEIARRVLRSARALGLATVAVASDADQDAPYTREADTVVRLPGHAPADTYLRADLLVAAALAAGAGAVHPGYGFLSENPAFAAAVTQAGLVWVGPPAQAIEAMGAKLAAKAWMAAAGVPVLPGVDTTGLTAEELAERVAAEVGFPVLVKANSGGGGRGMRRVLRAEELAQAVESARREAASAFGDPTVFCERLVVDPRHVEIQVLADNHGSVVALLERDCSVQRRHQKVLEESPSPAVDPALRARMSAAAVQAARSIGYTGAGTVEFVLGPGGEFAFLEMNTRLQVEHPVTEMVTGLDLVALQLRVAAGEPLPAEARQPQYRGHAIQARLYAEDPTRGWLPCTGTLQVWQPATGEGIRVDSGVEQGSVVGTDYDPMLAKVVAWGPTRTAAAARLARALRTTRVHGVGTNRDLLVRLLEHPEFLSGAADTGFLDRHAPAVLGAGLATPAAWRLHAVAAALAGEAAAWSGAGVLASLPAGWRSVRSQLAQTRLLGPGGEIVVGHACDHGVLTVTVDGAALPGLRLLACQGEPDGGYLVDLETDGGRRRYQVRHHGGAVFVDSPLGATAFRELAPLGEPEAPVAAGSLTAPMPGTVTQVWVRPGDQVAPGAGLVALEAMKMEHTVAAPRPGTVASVRVQVGEQVQAGAVLVTLEESPPEPQGSAGRAAPQGSGGGEPLG